MKTKHYQKPTLSIEEIDVERGIAASVYMEDFIIDDSSIGDSPGDYWTYE